MNRVPPPRRAVAAPGLAAVASLVCLAFAPSPASAGNCEAGHLESLLGKPYSEDRADAVSKASEIRKMTVGKTAGIADYRTGRLNIVVDLKGIVIRADCG
jgi:Peptidase inhibitor I78 family